MFKIGPLSLAQPTALAPMAALTDPVFRRLVDEIGDAGWLVSEMISAEGLRRRNRRTLAMLQEFPARIPQFLQLFGSEPDALSDAARITAAETSFSGIDINMGCPVPKVMRGGAGAGLLGDLRRMARLVRAVRNACRLPLTVKVRLGIARINVLDSARVIESEGADALAVHFRLKTDGYVKSSDWSTAEEIKARLHIPLIGNGDIDSMEQAFHRLETVDAVMIGRGAIADPFVFSKIAGKPTKAGQWSRLAARLCELVEEYYPEHNWISRIKGFTRYMTFNGRVSRSRKKPLFLAATYPEVKNRFLELAAE